MKIKYLPAALAILSMASCSALKSTFNRSTDTTEANAPQPIESSAQALDTVPATPDLVSAELPYGRTHSAKVRHRSLLYGQLRGQWTIVRVGKRNVPFEDDMPYIIFDEAQWRFYANNGCNTLNGTFLYNGESSVSFSSVLSTQMLCHDAVFETEINGVLRDDVTVNVKIEQKGLETYAVLSNAKGTPLLTLRRHNLEAINGQWDVTEIAGEKTKDAGINIFFDIPELKVHGNSGCNYFNGTIEIDPYVSSSISFRNMAVTMRACPNLDLETKFLVSLEQVARVQINNAKHITLLDAKGKKIVELYKEQ